ncbi:DinB family protein [Paenibacillus sp. Marseille-Q4541]|uniref:DinB family protein n=1 Tax=Paenibacillus sp. Marseille-Q4541 TaxID=2831522 RepID=UPI001BA6A1E9|nr:DinB family protein [Paenibacillus sp. Marseille-Q4541]
MSTFDTIMPVWNAIQSRFHNMVTQLTTEELALQMDESTIGYMLRHNAEVEYMFAAWFFNKPMPEGLAIHTGRGASRSKATFTNLEELVQFLEASQTWLIQGMSELSEEEWNEVKKCPIGDSTPLEAVGRLMYHTGIHAGQISYLRKLHAAKQV